MLVVWTEFMDASLQLGQAIDAAAWEVSSSHPKILAATRFCFVKSGDMMPYNTDY